jgi:phage/plasmid-like protein (TIGR03299 family)
MFFNVGDNRFDTDMFALVRDKDNTMLGSCKDTYKIFQNLDGFEWCRPLVESGMWKYESAGALKGGIIGWILLNQGEVELVKNDKLEQYLLLTWSHDGSKCIQALPTSIRVVCNNTLTQALNTAVFKNKVRHSEKMNWKLEEIKKMYSESKETFANQNEVFSRMLDFKMTDGMIEKYIDDVLVNSYGIKEIDGMKDGRAKTTALKTKATLLDAAYNGSGTKELGIGNTMYAVFNGIEEAVEHSLGGNRVKDRGYNILF